MKVGDLVKVRGDKDWDDPIGLGVIIRRWQWTEKTADYYVWEVLFEDSIISYNQDSLEVINESR